MNIGIKSDDRVVIQITGQGTSQAKGLELSDVGTVGGFRFEAEQRCSDSYAKGKREADQIRQYLLDTYRYMDQISETFLEADRKAARANLSMAIRSERS